MAQLVVFDISLSLEIRHGDRHVGDTVIETVRAMLDGVRSR